MKIVECPRDAMQGITAFIPSETKADYLNMLLKVGFDTLDFGSFVSPKAIPQMRDTAAVLQQLNWAETNTKLLAIVANQRGAIDAASFAEISYLGYPFSVSETFQQRNTNKSIDASLILVEELQSIAQKSQKELVVYLSMAFGNPHADAYHPDIVAQWADKLAQLDVKILAFSDTIGCATPKIIGDLFSTLIPAFPHIEFGAHLHTLPSNWYANVLAAYSNGCQRFDTTMQGLGGCPLAKDDLTGNLPTEKLLSFLIEQKETHDLKAMAFESAYNKAMDLFRNYK